MPKVLESFRFRSEGNGDSSVDRDGKALRQLINKRRRLGIKSEDTPIDLFAFVDVSTLDIWIIPRRLITTKFNASGKWDLYKHHALQKSSSIRLS